ncbi:MAG: DNA ligase-associated DEXH box helicase, partial [Rhodobacterales bacterium]|nr:DNA ligase-associated DEXH box helicase [Rhodobacterales bacterium]
MAQPPLLTFTDRGIWCPEGDFHIDPWRPVDRALITHGHSDHARPGHGAYLATRAALPVMRQRLGDIRAEGIGWGERRQIGGVTVSFHPAGHVPGSAQIRVERGGEIWVVSGDYKTEADGLSEPFEPVACHSFVSECTFGLPVFRWPPQAQLMADINRWWADNAAAGRISLLGCYSLGKAQ